MNNSMNTYREEKHFSEILEKSRLFPNSALPISQQLNEENRGSSNNSHINIIWFRTLINI